MSPVVRSVKRLEKNDFVPNKLCVAVFGPGHGEAIVVRLPDGRIGVVDGCREEGDPVARIVTALREGDGRPLAFACLTHAHQDHYRGMGKLLQQVEHNVDCVWSGCLNPGNFAQISKAAKARRRRKDAPDPDDLAALGRLTTAFIDVSNKPDKEWIMVRGTHGAQRSFGDVATHWVGPAPRDEMRANIDMAAYLEEILSRKRAGSFDPNATSVALVLEWKQTRVLLGGDLVVGKGHYRGWTMARDFLPPGRYSVVNVAHHASLGAHDDDAWTALGSDGIALVTPYQYAKNGMPPTREDILRLLKLGWRVVVTATPAWLDASGAAPGLKTSAVVAPTETIAPTATELADETFDDASPECAALTVLNDDGNVAELVLAQNAREYSLA